MLYMISTGSNALDALLKVRRGLLYCIFGAAGSGKTQLCMQLIVNTLKQERGSILVIDAKGEFRVERIVELLYLNDVKVNDVERLTDRVYITRVYTVDELIRSLQYMYSDRILVVVEDAPLLVRAEYAGKGREGSLMMMKFMHDLAVNTVMINSISIVTNGITYIDGAERQIMDRPLSIFSHYKLMLKRISSRNDYTLINATLTYPMSGSANFFICREGIRDVDVL